MTSLGIFGVVSVIIVSSSAVNGALNCPAINEPGVKNFTMRLSATNVPNVKTTVTCAKFLLPNDSVYDIIAMEPFIDNAEIADRVFLFACNQDANASPTNQTHTCGYEGVCPNIVAYWVRGMNGQCMSNQYGIRIGPGFFQYAELKVHYTISQLTAGLTDSSGMIIYYTDRLRPNPGGSVLVGQYYLDIPPGLPAVTATGSCASGCTKRFPTPIYISSVLLYMQLIGSSANVTLYRHGSLVQVLQSVSKYDFNMPTRTELESPIEVKQGDEIRVTCVYNSTSRSTDTHIGPSTTDEYCTAVLSYYPLINGLLYCSEYKTAADACSTVYDILSPLCDAQKFVQYSETLTSGPCSQNCETTACGEIMKEVYATGCLNYADFRNYLRTWIPSFVPVLANCEFANPMPSTCPDDQQ